MSANWSEMGLLEATEATPSSVRGRLVVVGCRKARRNQQHCCLSGLVDSVFVNRISDLPFSTNGSKKSTAYYF